MKNTRDRLTELYDLAAVQCDGTLAVEQLARLESLVLDDTVLRRHYVAYTHIHATAEQHLSDILSEETAQPATPTQPAIGFLADSARQTREYFSQPGPLSVLVAAIFMVCMVSVLSILTAPTYTPTHIGSNNTTNSLTNSPGRQPRDVTGKLKLVARITGLHNCRWSPEGRAPLSYDHLGLGRELKLDAGLLEITYYNGAKVVLEGPVEFTVEKPNACRLDIGRLTAKVSEQAVGFTVETPDMSIVDLGTKFGVEVEQGGDADVHVFVGQVEVAQIVGGTRRKIRLGKGQSVRFDAGAGKLVTLPAGSEQFARAASFAATIGEAVPLPLHDDFNDECINYARWLTKTSGTANVTATGRQMRFTDRGYLYTRSEYDPDDYSMGIKVKCTWTVGEVPGNHSGFILTTRSDAVPVGPSRQPRNGVACMVFDSLDKILIHEYDDYDGTTGRTVLVDYTPLGFAISAGDVIGLEMTDNGADITFTVTKGANSKTFTTPSYLTSDLSSGANHILFHNHVRMEQTGVTSCIDDVTIIAAGVSNQTEFPE